MIRFREFSQLIESKQLPFDSKRKIGWWRDGENGQLILYHGTHKRNVPEILKNGLNRPDPKTNMISTTPDPHTGHGYAAMSGSGGEAHFRAAGGKAVHTPEQDRAVLRLHIPKEWAEEHMDHNLSGNVGVTRDRMRDRKHYDAHKGSDSEYYAASEVRFKKPIPKEFIAGYMHKK